MSKLCDNTLLVKAHSKEVESQLLDFITKSKSKDQRFTIEGTYSIPPELDFVSTQNSNQWLALLLFRNGDDSMVKEYFSYPYIKDAGTTDAQSVARCLTQIGSADQNLGLKAFNCLRQYGAKDVYDWSYKYWGTRWIHDSEIKRSKPNYFVVTFNSKNSPPDLWLKKVSLDYPELHFSLEWEIPFINAGIIDAVNGSVIEHRKFC